MGKVFVKSSALKDKAAGVSALIAAAAAAAPQLVKEDKPKSKAKGGGKASFTDTAALAVADKPKPKNRADEMPIISEFDKADMDAALSYMQADVAAAKEMDRLKIVRETCKQKLGEIAKRRLVPGMRHGRIVVYFNGYATKKSLNRGLLIENGVEPWQLEASMKESKPFLDLKIVDLDKPKKGKGGDGEDGDDE